MKKQTFPETLKAICLLGLAVAVLLGAAIFFISYISGSLFAPKTAPGGVFYRELQEYDRLAAGGTSPVERLISILDGLEKKALGVESHLSVLKRRRNLARLPLSREISTERRESYRTAYRAAAERATEAFPYSENLAAIAAEAVILENYGSSVPAADRVSGRAADRAASKAEDLRTELSAYASKISDSSLLPLALCLRVLAGETGDPQSAQTIPQSAGLFASLAPYLTEREREDFLVNATILRLIERDTAEAASLVVSMLHEIDNPSAKVSRFAGEFFYDHGDPLRAAEFFSRYSGEQGIARQADALYLAGRPGDARSLWAILLSPGRNGEDQTAETEAETAPLALPTALSAALPEELRVRILYNLAATAETREEAMSRLEQMFRSEGQGSGTPSPGIEAARFYGAIRYTRLLDIPRSTLILEDLASTPGGGLAALERIRRLRSQWTIDKTIAEIWTLLDRRPDDGEIYQWGAYYFDLQKRYGDTALLIKRAERSPGGTAKTALALHQGLTLIREGRLDQGEETLRAADGQDTLWQIPANIARILEARYSPNEALEYYEEAAALVQNRKEAAKIQLRIARCLQSLGRDGESRRVLEYALALDEENLNARLELHRLDDAGIF